MSRNNDRDVFEPLGLADEKIYGEEIEEHLLGLGSASAINTINDEEQLTDQPRSEIDAKKAMKRNAKKKNKKNKKMIEEKAIDKDAHLIEDQTIHTVDGDCTIDGDGTDEGNLIKQDPKMVAEIIKKDIVLIQQFTASCVALLNLLKSYAEKELQDLATQEEGTETIKNMTKYKVICAAIDKYMKSLSDDAFNYKDVLRKIYEVFKIEEATIYLKECNPKLFTIENEDKKIISILPSINFRIVYPLLYEEDRNLFWQYLNLMVLSTLNIFYLYNPKNLDARPYIMEMIKDLGKKLEESGVKIDQKIFNPYLGLGRDSTPGGYSLDEMLTVAEMIDKESGPGSGIGLENMISLDGVLKTLGITNLIDLDEIEQKIASLNESDLEYATDKIASLLGNDNPNTREICGKLVKNIVSEMKANGIKNMDTVLKSVMEKSTAEIGIENLADTVDRVHDLMTDGQERLKDLTDEAGNPVGEHVLKTMAPLMSIAKKFKKKKKK